MSPSLESRSKVAATVLVLVLVKALVVVLGVSCDSVLVAMEDVVIGSGRVTIVFFAAHTNGNGTREELLALEMAREGSRLLVCRSLLFLVGLSFAAVVVVVVVVVVLVVAVVVVAVMVVVVVVCVAVVGLCFARPCCI
jgi:hypothetical protein